MKIFHCGHCRYLLFFESVQCLGCGHSLAYQPDRRDIGSLEPAGEGLWKLPGTGNGRGVAFEFLADPETPGAEPVLTGHNQGFITINLAEADDAEREKRRAQLHEPYRLVPLDLCTQQPEPRLGVAGRLSLRALGPGHRKAALRGRNGGSRK